MIDKIISHPVLKKFICDTCSENDISLTFDESILKENYVIIKVDKFYNSLNLKPTPASPDCLIIRKCINGGFGLTIVELKKIQNSKGFTTENLKEKFETCLGDFIPKKFKNELFKDYKDIKLYFVSNIELYKRDFGLKLETLINLKFSYKDRKYMIQPRMPNPTITNCH